MSGPLLQTLSPRNGSLVYKPEGRWDRAIFWKGWNDYVTTKQTELPILAMKWKKEIICSRPISVIYEKLAVGRARLLQNLPPRDRPVFAIPRYELLRHVFASLFEVSVPFETLFCLRLLACRNCSHLPDFLEAWCPCGLSTLPKTSAFFSFCDWLMFYVKYNLSCLELNRMHTEYIRMFVLDMYHLKDSR
jgi:hypothetical protein